MKDMKYTYLKFTDKRTNKWDAIAVMYATECLQKIQTWTGFELMTSAIPALTVFCQAHYLTNQVLVILWICNLPIEVKGRKWNVWNTYIWTRAATPYIGEHSCSNLPRGGRGQILPLKFVQMPWNLETLSEIYLGIILLGQLVFTDFDVTIATDFWQAVFQKMQNPIFKLRKILFLWWLSCFYFILVFF